MKRFVAGFATAYLLAGLMFGEALATAVPATNHFGVVYLAVIWPAWIAQIWTGWNPYVPGAVFTF
jgi:hypothetical protein